MKYVVKSEEEWLELRKQCITASNTAVLVGADPYNSPAKLRKPSTFTGNAYTNVGHLLEPIVVEEVNKALGMSFKLYENKKGWKEFYIKDNLGATPDAHQDRNILLECKTVNANTYKKYNAVPPGKYIIQLIAQLICTDIKEGYLALLNTGLKSIKAYELFLKNPDLRRKRELSVFKLLNFDEISSILKTEAKRFKEEKTFKVKSKVKQKVKLLLPTTYERVI